MAKYHEEARKMLEERTALILTNEQIDALIPMTGLYAEEILEGSVWDTAPREVLISALCEKITGRASWTNGEIMEDREAYKEWVGLFVKNAFEMGYNFADEEE